MQNFLTGLVYFFFQINKPRPFDQVRDAYFTAVLDKPNELTTSDNLGEVSDHKASIQVTLMPRLRQKRQISDWTLKCSKCDRHFVTETLLEKHISLKHPESRAEVTNSMQYEGSNYSRKNGTSSQVSSANGKLRCPVCDRAFINEPLLKQHVSRMHLISTLAGPWPSEESVLNTCYFQK